MKKLLILSAILSTVFAVDAQSLNKFPSLDGYDLVFSDEFDGTQLNKEVWKVEVTDNGGGNNELQYYVNDNVKVADGNLVITARRQRYGTKDFTSGRINSLERVAFKHGIVQARIKLPQTANGLWPAFWLMGNDINRNNWPNCGEIDVLEAGGSQGIKTGTPDRFFISALHWGPYTNGQHPMYSCSTTADYSIQDDNFHLFTLVWDENKISMYLDDLPTPYFEMNITDNSQQNSPGNYFHKRFFLLFNLAVGGTMTDIFNPNDITALVYGERSMYVDYVRVYQKRNEKDYLIPGADVTGGEEPVITEDTVTQLGNYGSLSLDEDGKSTFDFENSSDFVVIGASKGVIDQMGDRIRANYSVDDIDNYLYIWEGTYDPRPTDGVNSFGLKETWNSYVVKSAGWSGLGYASSGSSKPGKDMSMLDEDGYILHFAMRGTDDLLHTNHAVGVGAAAFTIGSAPFVDGNKILPVLGDFKRDGRWCSFDIPVSVLKNLGTPLYPQMDAVKDNVLYFLSGGNAGAELQFDNVFFYKNPNINTDLPTTDENTKIGKYAKPSLNADGESTFDFDDAYDYVVIGASNGVIDQMGQDNIVANYSVDDVNNYLYVWEETYEPRATEGVNSFGLEEKWNSYVVLNKGWSGLGYASTNAAGTAKGKDLSMLDDSYYLHFAMRGTDLIRHTSHTVGVGASQFIIGNTTNAAAMLGDFKRDGQWYSFDIPFSEILMSGGNPFTEDGGVNAYQGNVISFLSGGTPGVELQFDNIFFYKKHSDSGHTIDYDPELGRYGYKALDDEGNPVF
ncbi:MAG: glycoside hydrolase family 16 protein, partial [Muribaculaceae bacterium]|nr:glycoside hydrolase family 16 protein [Muribaculaceae bacterium]